MLKRNKFRGKRKKFLVIFIGLVIFFLAVFGIIFYFDIIKSSLKKPSATTENYQDLSGNSVNSEINLIAENNTISPDYRLAYQKENSFYITCLNSKIAIKYQDQEKEMIKSDYDDLWSVLNGNDVWNLPSRELGSMTEGAGIETVTISLGNNPNKQKSTSFAVMNPSTKNEKQFNIINKLEELKNKYFPS